MKIDNISIYIDFKALHELLYKAQFTMSKGNRIIMGNRLLDLSQNCVSILSRAASESSPERKLDLIMQLTGEFDALRLNLQSAEHLRMFCEKLQTVDRANGESQKVGSLVLSIFERVANIDEGIGRWRSATRARIMPKKA